MMKIKWFENPYHLVEVSQDTGIIFSFVTKEGKQCHLWVKCRDFLHDVVQATITKKACSIYQLKYDLGKPQYAPVDMETTRLMVSQQGLLDVADSETPTKVLSFDDKMKHAVLLLNHYEDMIGESHSKVTKGKDGTKWYWIFEGPSFWMKSAPLVSLYSYLIRLGDKKIKFNGEEELQVEFQKLLDNGKLGGDRDVQYLKDIKDKLGTVVKNHKEILLEGGDIDKDYKNKKISNYTFHDCGGIQSLCQAIHYFNIVKSKLMFPEMFEEQAAKAEAVVRRSAQINVPVQSINLALGDLPL